MILDLAPIIEGGDAAGALRNSLDLARHAERWGYRRFWLAEHHNMPGIASAATAVVDRPRRRPAPRPSASAPAGSCCPNHAPLVIAEQFGTLEALYPGRIDLGLGPRARHRPGDRRAPCAATWTAAPTASRSDVVELMAYFGRPQPRPARSAPCRAPASTCRSGSSAPASSAPQLAADAGPALRLRLALRAGAADAGDRDLPRALPALGAAGRALRDAGLQRRSPPTPTRRRARLLTSLQQAFVNLRTRPARRAAAAASTAIDEPTRARRAAPCSTSVLSCSAVGSPETVRRGLPAFIARTGADELMITSQIFDHAARLRSFEIAAEARAPDAQYVSRTLVARRTDPSFAAVPGGVAAPGVHTTVAVSPASRSKELSGESPFSVGRRQPDRAREAARGHLDRRAITVRRDDHGQLGGSRARSLVFAK